jgi:DNA-directed RNA polymerase specialized sigma24 family protein
MTFGEIAAEMNLSVNTVKTRFYSMLRRIREEVDFDE